MQLNKFLKSENQVTEEDEVGERNALNFLKG